jgi:hypothetical protein
MIESGSFFYVSGMFITNVCPAFLPSFKKNGERKGMNIMNERFKISAKMLGELTLPFFCPRCFWLRLKCHNHLPFQKFAGISMIIDSFTKRTIRTYIEQNQKAPVFLNTFGDLTRTISVPHHSKFFWDDPKTGIRLTGVPDDIFLRNDSAFVIADYKCAKLNDNQNEILPMYEVQLNGYALIAEEYGYAPVSQVGLVYFEPQTTLESDIPLEQNEEGFDLSFKAKFHEVKLDPRGIIMPLLEQAQNLAEMKKPPESREGCKDCGMVHDLVELFCDAIKVR